MRSVHKSVLVPYSAQQMFDLVERVEDYPKFLPWCGGTRILQQTADETLARIDIDYRGVRAHFTTANRNQPPDRIVVELRDGPFRRLDGIWQFRALSESACKVEFELNYEFATTGAGKADRSGLRPYRRQLHRRLRQARGSRPWQRRMKRIAVTVVYALPAGATEIELELPVGSSVADALARSGIAARHPEIDLAAMTVGVYGVRVALDSNAGRSRPGRNLPAAAGRPEGSPAPARRSPQRGLT